MSQTQHVSGRATTIFTDEKGYTNIRYHQTNIVSFNDKHIILQSGGYRSLTTKTRINQASNQFGLGYTVTQKDYNWFISFKGKEISFTDGIILKR